MKITMYELFGMVRDGKEPKKIYYNRNVYRLNIYKHYIRTEIYTDKKIDLLDDLRLQDDFLNDEVEILEEEKKIPEKINLDKDELRGKETPRAIDYLIESKINQVIDYLKSKGE